MAMISLRTDPVLDEALHRLMTQTASHRTRSEVIRQAVLDAAKELDRLALRQECAQLMADPAEIAASKALAAEMAQINAW